jgi:hypothetical protein
MICRGLTVILVVLLGAIGTAQRPSPAGFRHERSIQVGAPGPQRLEVDVTLLVGSRPFHVAQRGNRHVASGGLGDLRLFSSSGAEVPYVLVPPPVLEPTWIDGRVLGVALTEKTSGFEVDLGDLSEVDGVRLDGLRPPFLKRFVLEGSGDRQRWTLLVSEGTAFDLPAEELRHTAIGFEAGSYRYLRVTWDDTNSGRLALPGAVAARRVEPSGRGPILRSPLVVERRPSEPRRSRFRIRLPAAQLPIVGLELTVGGGHLLREAQVSEQHLSGDHVVPHRIGSALLKRVVRDGIAADALRIPITPPQEAQLDLVVEDGDNPPLELQGVTAVFAELPWIYFDSAAGTITARYGDARLDRPTYDLEAARADIPRATVARAAWGEERAIAESEAAAPLPLPDAGSSLEAGNFRYARAVPAGPEGLITIPLDAAVLAHSGALRSNFSDVRVLDRGGWQVPYLLERRDEPIALDVRIERRGLPPAVIEVQPWRTAYLIHLPYQVLPAARVALYTRSRVFQRTVTLGMLIAPTERRREHRFTVLATTNWIHVDQDTPAPALVMNVPERRGGELWLTVDEGDNQPLPIERATLLLPSYAVRLFRRPDLQMRLLYGRNDLGAPRFDLALLAPQVLGNVAREVYAGPEEPATAATSSIATIVSPPVFWASLGVAVVVLLGLIVRLIRREDAAGTT